MAKLLFSLFILLIVLQGVFSSCCTSSQPPEMNSDELFCMYNEIRVDNGTTYVSGAPACDSCTCAGTVLDCCKYGYQAGTAHIEGCFHQTIEGSCDFNFVKANSDPCEFK